MLQAYKTMTLRDMYLFTAADSGKVLEHFMLVARFKHRVFPLAQIWSSGVRLLLETAKALHTAQSLLCGVKYKQHSLSRSNPPGVPSVILVPWKQLPWEAWCRNTTNPTVDGAPGCLCTAALWAQLCDCLPVQTQNRLIWTMWASVGTHTNSWG